MRVTAAKIQAKDLVQKGLDICSYYITPVQRFTKYPLLFRELMKLTSRFHSDYDYIVHAQRLLEESTKTIQFYTNKIKKLSLLSEIQKRVTGFSVIFGDREIRDSADVRLSGFKSGKAVLYLFNGQAVLVHAPQKIFDPDRIDFSYACCSPDDACIEILIPESIVIQFDGVPRGRS
jgi:hypothetical protein